MRIAVKTSDSYLYQKIFLILESSSHVFRYCAEEDYDLLLSDAESDLDSGAIVMSREGAGHLSIPFTEKELKSIVFGEKTDTPSLVMGDRCVFLRGKKIALTELEFSLFSVLYNAKGEFVPREALHQKAFGENYTDGVLNVYVHYLREKLEREEEKIIISSRKHGYKISERYFKVC